jgi:hypothetical protein
LEDGCVGLGCIDIGVPEDFGGDVDGQAAGDKTSLV